MSVQIKFTTPAFHVVGDGVATSANLSTFEFPFGDAPKSRPLSVTVNDGGDHITSATVNGSLIVLTFDSAFSGDNGSSLLTVNYEV